MNIKLFILAFVLGAGLTLLLGYICMPVLRKMKVGQTINSLGPDAHIAKQGTLTMGGIFFIPAALIGSLVCLRHTYSGHLYVYSIMCTLAFAFIGFADDYIKVLKRRSEGLTPRQKLVPQVLFAVIFAFWAYVNPEIGSGLYIPFTSVKLNLGILYVPVVAFVIVAVDNSANLLDGLDGLCAGNSGAAFLMFAAACAISGGVHTNNALFAVSMCGAMIGFLRFNGHPARVFMGDTGSLGIGGALSALAITGGNVLILPLALITMLVTTGSDIVQVLYMKRHRGRKLLRMSPLHHHFELSGVPETRIVTGYNIAALLACALALIGIIR